MPMEVIGSILFVSMMIIAMVWIIEALFGKYDEWFDSIDRGLVLKTSYKLEYIPTVDERSE